MSSEVEFQYFLMESVDHYLEEETCPSPVFSLPATG